MEVCEKYEMVTMLFSDIVTFTVICSRLKPLQVEAASLSLPDFLLETTGLGFISVEQHVEVLALMLDTQNVFKVVALLNNIFS